MGTTADHPFIALDIETTGLDREQDQIIQIGATVYGAGRGAQLMHYVKHRRYSGNAFALALNQKVFKHLANDEGVTIEVALHSLEDFIKDYCCEKPYPVGFNIASFDLRMIRDAWDYWEGRASDNFVKALGPWPFHHRCIEIGSLRAHPSGVPASSAELAAQRGREVEHDALADALAARHYHEEWIKKQK